MATELMARPTLRAAFGSLRVKLAAATLAMLAAGALVGTLYVRDRLAAPYHQTVQAELEGVGRTLATELAATELTDPVGLHQRLLAVQRAHPRLLVLSVYRRESTGRVLVTSLRAPSAPGGTLSERRASRRTALGGYGLPPAERRRRAEPIGPEPADVTGLWVPIAAAGERPIGDLWLQIDRTETETALAGDVRHLIIAGVVLALLVGLLFATVLNRMVLGPLRQLREAIHEIRGGAGDTRLGWRRSDELGELSNDFDAMATELQETHSRLELLALKDPLTGLLNHRSFHGALRRELTQAAKQGTPLTLVALDLDHFKAINDTYGHPYGDEVLRLAAQRLLEAVRSDDLVARVGGEEFAIILPGADAKLGFAVAERARRGLAGVAVQGGRPLACSAGVAAFPAHAREGSALLKLADGALYWAKRSGRNQTRLFDPQHVTAAAPDEERTAIEAILARPESLRFAYQPWVELATGRLGGYEALARFEGPGNRTPDEWFAQAHRCELGDRLEALAAARALAGGDRPPGTFISINLSPSVLTSPAVHDALPESLARVVIEVTEQQAIVDLPGVQLALEEFRRRGARIALDDAGVGYSGLQELMRLRPDIIKLDRSLIRRLPDDPAKVALVESLVRFAQRTGAAVCAEGIEELDELVMLADLDVTYGQGYALARPAPPWTEPDEEMVDVLRRRSARSELDPAADLGSTDAGDRRLEQVCARIATSGAPEDLLGVFAIIGDELEADEVALSRWDQAARTVTTVVTTPNWPDPSGDTYDLREYPASERVLVTKEAAQMLVSDPAVDPAEAEMLVEDGFSAMLMVPVAFGGVTIGLLEIARCREQAFTRSQTNRARIISHQLGGLLASGRLGRSASIATLRYRGSRRLAQV